MSELRIDDAVLAVAKPQWKKVALVIAESAHELGDETGADEVCQLVASHIEALVREGHLEAQGNIKNWRSSEIRRPSQDAT